MSVQDRYTDHIEMLRTFTAPVDYSLQYDLIRGKLDNRQPFYWRSLLSVKHSVVVASILMAVGLYVTYPEKTYSSADQYVAQVIFDEYQPNVSLGDGFTDDGTFFE